MGLNVRSSLVIGVIVSRDDFFRNVGSEWRCQKGNHPRSDGSSAKFCEHCGSEFYPRLLQEPTVEFKTWAEEEEYSPEDWWDILERSRASSTMGGTYGCGFGLHCVDSVSSSTTSRKMFALGFKVMEAKSNYNNGRADAGLSLEFITTKMAEVETRLKQLGLDRRAQVFLNLHMSY